METSTLSNRVDILETNQWISHLETYGYVVIGNVLSQEECLEALKSMREVLATFSTKLSLEDDNTWAEHGNYPFNESGGMIQYIGHSKFQWDLREKVSEVFSKAWDCKREDLASSFDGFCYMDGRRGYKERSLLNNVHTDQSPTINKLWSYQGLVNLCENKEDDGGFVVVPKSHKYQYEFMKKIGYETFPLNYFQFESFDKTDPIFETGLKICAQAGDMILWDSRTFHGNTVPTSKNVRACVYICEIPKRFVSEQTRNYRKKAFEFMRCSTHHPGDGFDLFSEYPGENIEFVREAIKKVTIKFEDMTDLQKSLLCIE